MQETNLPLTLDSKTKEFKDYANNIHFKYKSLKLKNQNLTLTVQNGTEEFELILEKKVMQTTNKYLGTEAGKMKTPFLIFKEAKSNVKFSIPTALIDLKEKYMKKTSSDALSLDELNPKNEEDIVNDVKKKLSHGVKNEHNTLELYKKLGICTPETIELEAKITTEDLQRLAQHNSYIKNTYKINDKNINVEDKIKDSKVPILASKMFKNYITMREYTNKHKDSSEEKLKKIAKVLDTFCNNTVIPMPPNIIDKSSFFQLMLSDDKQVQDDFIKISAIAFAANCTDITGHENNVIFVSKAKNGQETFTPAVIDGGHSFQKYNPDNVHAIIPYIRFFFPLFILHNLPVEAQKNFITYYNEALLHICIDKKFVDINGQTICSVEDFKKLSPQDASKSFQGAKEKLRQEFEIFAAEDKGSKMTIKRNGVKIESYKHPPCSLLFNSIEIQVAQSLGISVNNLIPAIYQDFNSKQYIVDKEDLLNNSVNSEAEKTLDIQALLEEWNDIFHNNQVSQTSIPSPIIQNNDLGGTVKYKRREITGGTVKYKRRENDNNLNNNITQQNAQPQVQPQVQQNSVAILPQPTETQCECKCSTCKIF